MKCTHQVYKKLFSGIRREVDTEMEANTIHTVNGSNVPVKIMILCATGMSSGLLLKKMNQYSESHGLNWTIQAETVFVYDSRQRVDAVLIAPQVGYKLQEVRRQSGVPCAVLDAFDYATGNCSHIAGLVRQMTDQ